MTRVAPILLASLVALVSLLAGCGPRQPAVGPDGRKIVRTYVMFISTRQNEYFDWAERAFEAQNPDIDVVIEQFPGSSLKDFEIKLRLRFSSGTPPDIFLSHEDVMANFARLGLLAPAPDFIERMVQENSVNEMVRRAPYVADTCYGIANDAVWQVLYYNKAMFREAGLDPERPPLTWQELLEYADRLTIRRADGTPMRTGFSLRKTGFKPGTAQKWFTFLYSAGGELFNEDGTEARFNSEAGMRALGLYGTILFDRRIDDVSLEGDQQGFGQGRVAMFLREQHVVRWLEDNYPDLEFGVGPVPADVHSISSGGSYVFSVSRDSPNQDEAWRFIRFLMEDEAYARYVSIGGLSPVTQTVADLPEYRDDPYLQQYFQQDVISPEFFPGLPQASEILGGYIERFCYGHMSAQEALHGAERDVNGLLMRNR